MAAIGALYVPLYLAAIWLLSSYTTAANTMLNLTHDDCQVSRMKGPYKMETPWQYSSFTVDLHLKEVKAPLVEKVGAHIYKIAGDFGYFSIYGGDFLIDSIYIKSPGEHYYYGMKYSGEMQFVGWKNKASKGVLIVHLEEVEDGDNEQLSNIGIDAAGTLGKWPFGKKQTFVYASFDPKKFIKATDYSLYIGSSSNENCERALIIHSQHSELISKDQMKNFGGSTMEAIFKPQTLLNDLTIMQNFASLGNDRFDPLMKVLKKNDFLPPAFPVAMQYGAIMYNPQDHSKLGDIPSEAIPFWMQLPADAKVTQIAVLPKTPEGFKLLVYYYLFNKESQSYDPFYVIVPNTFSPNPGQKPNKVPILIRAKKAYPNLSRAVVKVDMVVRYAPILPKSKPRPPKKPRVPSRKEQLELLFPRIKQARDRIMPRKAKSLAQGAVSADPKPAPQREASTTPATTPQYTPMNITRVCKRYKFEVVLNVRRDQWNYIPNLPESLQAMMNECEEWDYVVTGGVPIPAGQANGTAAPSGPTKPSPTGSPSTGPSQQPAGGSSPTATPQTGGSGNQTESSQIPEELIKQFCKKQELHVVLNRESAPEVQDYVRQFCQNLIVNGQQHSTVDRKAALARLREDYTKYLARRVMSAQARQPASQLLLRSTS